MKLNKLIPMLVAAVAIASPLAAVAQARHVPPPPPPGVKLRPGMMWCSKCGGDGKHGRTWYGRRKTCHTCKGTGMLAIPPPPPPKAHPHPKPVVPAPKPVAAPAPKPVVPASKPVAAPAPKPVVPAPHHAPPPGRR